MPRIQIPLSILAEDDPGETNPQNSIPQEMRDRARNGNTNPEVQPSKYAPGTRAPANAKPVSEDNANIRTRVDRLDGESMDDYEKRLSEQTELITAHTAEQKLAVAQSKAGPDRAVDPNSILNPSEMQALTTDGARLQGLAEINQQAADETAVPKYAGLPLMAVKGAMAAVDATTVALTGSKAHTSGAQEAIPDVQGIPGAITKTVSQMAVSLIAAGKFTGGIGVGATLGRTAQSLATGGIADAVGFEGNGGHLSDLVEGFVQENPFFKNPFSRWLSTHPDDGEATGRFKNFIEGLGMGAMGEALFSVFRGYRAAKAAKSPKEAQAILSQTSQEVQKITESTPQVPLKSTAAPAALISPEAAVRLRESVTKAAETGKLMDLPVGISPNPAHISATEGAQGYLRAIANEVGDVATKMTGGIEYHPELKELATNFAMSPEALLEKLKIRVKDVNDLSKEVVAGRIAVVTLARDIDEAAAAVNAIVKNGGDSAVAEAELARLMNLHADIQVHYKQVQTAGARVPASGNINVEALAEGVDYKTAAKLIATAEGDPTVLGKILEPQSLGGKVLGVVNEVRMNSMLSGVASQVVNLLGNAYQSLVMPAAEIIGGYARRDPEAMTHGARLYTGLTKAAYDSVQMAYISLAHGDSFLDAALKPTENITHAIASGSDTIVGKMINALGTTIRLPIRMMGSVDEGFKQLNYRAHVYADAAGEGARKGLQGQALADWVENSMNRAFNENGKGIDEAALAFARENTFSSPLDYGIGGTLQQAVIAHPGLRLVIPFVKAPTNIFRQQWAHTPGLQYLQKQWVEDMRAGGTRAARAQGKQIIGATLYTAAAMMVGNGLVTGRGPMDPEQRKALKATGWQPYSFKIGDEYVSFARFDQVGMFFGLTADFAEAAGQAKGDAESMAAAMTTALAANMTSKTYLLSLSEAINTLSHPDRAGVWYQRMATSFIPNTKQFTDMIPETRDPYLREARSIVDAIRAKIPGLSQGLPPQRNLWGQPIQVPYGFGLDTLNPFYTSSEKNDPVATELAKFRKGFERPVDKIGSVDLTEIKSHTGQTAYDRLQELVGTVRINGKTLYETFEKEHQTETYKNRLTDDAPGYDGSKYKRNTTILGAFKAKALATLTHGDEVRKFNGLEEAVKQDRMNKYQAVRKGPGAVTDIQSIIEQFQQ